MDKLYIELASCVAACANCVKSNNQEWLDKHQERILKLVKEHMPSGAGFDSGTTLDMGRSTSEKLVFETAFHHMGESGMYDGWTNHTVTARPSFVHGFTLGISGPNRNDIKEYVSQTFHDALTTLVVSE